MKQRVIALLAMLTPPWFVAVYLVMSSMRPEYSHTEQAISELGSLDAPNLWAWNVLGYILPGLVVALLGLGLLRALGMHRGARWASLAVVAAGLCMSLSGVFPANMADFKSTTTLLHTLGSFGCYIAFLIAGFSLPSVLRRADGWRWVAAPSLLLVLASIATGVLRFAGMASIGQRLTFACFFLWVFMLALALWRADAEGEHSRGMATG